MQLWGSCRASFSSVPSELGSLRGCEYVKSRDDFEGKSYMEIPFDTFLQAFLPICKDSV